MENDRGLLPVPRGLDRTLTGYLNSVSTLLTRLAGQIRNSEDTRALRVNESIITTSKIKDGAVTTKKIKNGAITASKLADGCITQEKLDGLSFEVTATVGPNSVTTNALVDGAVTTTKLAAGAVTSVELAASSVEESKIADNAITGQKISDGSVAYNKLASNAKTTIVSGQANDGEVVTLPGYWTEAPMITLTYTGGGECGIENVEGAPNGTWQFTAKGNIGWAAIGYQQ